MKKNTFALKGPKGVTLIELTVVIAIILVLISVLFIGANYYRTNANRAACIINITNLHKAARTVENVSGTAPAAITDFTGANTPIPNLPTCPQDNAAYVYAPAGFNAAAAAAGGPAMVTCANFDTDANNTHRPADTRGW